MDVDGGRRTKQQKVCIDWTQGECTRFPCPLRHSLLPTHQGFGAEDNHRGGGKQQIACIDWTQGKCTRSPCPFAHSELPTHWFGATEIHRGGRINSKQQEDNLCVSGNNSKQQKVCINWTQGKCTRFPCPLRHSQLPTGNRAHQGFGAEDNHRGGSGLRRSGNYNAWDRVQSLETVSSNRTFVKKIKKLCNHCVQGSCIYVDNCKYLHQWSTGDCFSLLRQLEGHQQVDTVIALPSGSDKLYSGSQDETVRDYQSCQEQRQLLLQLRQLIPPAEGYSVVEGCPERPKNYYKTMIWKWSWDCCLWDGVTCYLKTP